jgi:serine/threonine protein kinase
MMTQSQNPTNASERHLIPVSPPKKIRWRGRPYDGEFRLELDGKSYYIVKKLSNKRQRYMAFDPNASPQGDMRCIIGIDRKNLSTKKQPPGLVAKLQRLSQANSNLPPIISYHPRGGRVYLVTPFFDGIPLGNYLEQVRRRKASRPSAREACMLIRGLAHGLHHYHAINLVHGDLNPDNLIMRRNPNRLVMVDLGSAWLVEHTVRRARGDGIRPHYAAPELYSDHPFVDARSDQFTLGLIFYEMLTLEKPYDGLGGQAAAPHYQGQVEKLYRDPQSLSPDRHHLPRDAWRLINRIVRRCLQFSPDDRYPRDRALLDAFDDLKEALRPRRLSRVNEWVLSALTSLSRIQDWISGRREES